MNAETSGNLPSGSKTIANSSIANVAVVIVPPILGVVQDVYLHLLVQDAPLKQQHLQQPPAVSLAAF